MPHSLLCCAAYAAAAHRAPALPLPLTARLPRPPRTRILTPLPPVLPCHQARLKYLVHEWGIDKFRTVAEQYYGKRLAPYRPLPAWEFLDYMGWMDQGDGRQAYGVYVQNGRIKGDVKKALRTVIERYDLPVSITPNQNLILRDVDPAWKEDILATLQASLLSFFISLLP